MSAAARSSRHAIWQQVAHAAGRPSHHGQLCAHDLGAQCLAVGLGERGKAPLCLPLEVLPGAAAQQVVGGALARKEGGEAHSKVGSRSGRGG